MPKQLTIPLHSVILGERTRQDYGDLKELIDSISDLGLLHPIAVKDNSDGTYLLLGGGRRVAAFAQLGRLEIPAHVFADTLTPIEVKEAELAENLFRKDFSWAEAILLKKQIHEMMIEKYGEQIGKTADSEGWSQTKTARILGETKAGFGQDLKMAKAIENCPDLARLKNKKEAQKVIAKATAQANNSIVADRMAQINESSSRELVAKAALCDNYIISDALKRLTELPSDHFDLIEIDPPYGIGLDNSQTRKEYRASEVQGYNEIPAEAYESFLRTVLTESFRIIKPKGWILLWHSLYPWYPSIVKLAQELNHCGSLFPAFWFKPASSNQSPMHNLAHNYEPFVYLRKGPAILAKPGSLSTFAHKTVPPTSRIHPTERPVPLIKEILSTFLTGKDQKVLVPFLGSGNTILAATELGHKAFGYDLSTEYRNSFVSRVMALPYGSYSTDPLTVAEATLEMEKEDEYNCSR